MPTRPSGSSNRYDPITSIGSPAAGPHGWVGAHAAMSSAFVGVIVARWKRAMAETVRRRDLRQPLSAFRMTGPSFGIFALAPALEKCTPSGRVLKFTGQFAV